MEALGCICGGIGEIIAVISFVAVAVSTAIWRFITGRNKAGREKEVH